MIKKLIEINLFFPFLIINKNNYFLKNKIYEMNGVL